jgi:hypothetical protein
MLSKVADWSSIAGVLLGTIGLLFSVLAFWAAKRARQAAEAARRDVRNLVAADRFHHLNSSAAELFSHVEHDNLAVASFLARYLRVEISEAISRWEFLDSATEGRFLEASRLSQQVGAFLRSRSELELRDKAKLLRKCDEIAAILSGNRVKYSLG